jgi:hypothetical protein
MNTACVQAVLWPVYTNLPSPEQFVGKARTNLTAVGANGAADRDMRSGIG